MTAPERIWAGPDGRYWADEDDGNGVDVEYVLASRVVPALEAADALAEHFEKYAILEEEAADAGDAGEMDAAMALYGAAFDEWAKAEEALVRYREARGHE